MKDIIYTNTENCQCIYLKKIIRMLLKTEPYAFIAIKYTKHIDIIGYGIYNK